MEVRISLTGALLVLLLLVRSAAAEWSVTSSEAEKSSAANAEHRRIELAESGSGNNATIDLVLFSAKSAQVRVVDNPTGDDLASVAPRLRAVAGVNGGYFDPQNLPVGLLVADGKQIAPFRKARLLSGVLAVNKNRLEIVRSAEYGSRKNVTSALQCGPFLVDGGTAVPGLNATRPARRTFVLTCGSDRAAIGYCSSVTLAELGDILVAADLRVQRALNLDGGSSSAFWFAGEHEPVSMREAKTVRNFVIVTPK